MTKYGVSQILDCAMIDRASSPSRLISSQVNDLLVLMEAKNVDLRTLSMEIYPVAGPMTNCLRIKVKGEIHG